MPQDNVEIVRRFFAAFERDDLTGMLELMTDDLVTHRPYPDRTTYHGKEGFLEASADWTEGFRDWTATPEQYLDADGHVLVSVRQTGCGEGSGVPVEMVIWFVFELRDAEIARVSFHARKSEALEAAGLDGG